MLRRKPKNSLKRESKLKKRQRTLLDACLGYLEGVKTTTMDKDKERKITRQ
jgi:hypothetical protein